VKDDSSEYSSFYCYMSSSDRYRCTSGRSSPFVPRSGKGIEFVLVSVSLCCVYSQDPSFEINLTGKWIKEMSF